MNTKSLHFRGAVSKWVLWWWRIYYQSVITSEWIIYPGTRHDLKEIIFKGSEVCGFYESMDWLNPAFCFLAYRIVRGDDVVVDEDGKHCWKVWDSKVIMMILWIHLQELSCSINVFLHCKMRNIAWMRRQRGLLTSMKKRTEAKIAAETAGRQRGLNMKETDKLGKDAYLGIPDVGPWRIEIGKCIENKRQSPAHGSMWLVRKLSNLRWEHGASTRIGEEWGVPKRPLLVKKILSIAYSIDIRWKSEAD